ncbi:EAL domain-containing protein [Roseomonas nepalensis]|uniref:EAL domain-containing protein n=1 Tax=Muricoccus nepalensis TaxID=1854500 RepID=A0A502G114_9PROT|nr:EAL domain-containing protein [Roseomonas nepalensis]TPG55469.1 EAL domain-containing protein [Roseomonas nepalensis]
MPRRAPRRAARPARGRAAPWIAGVIFALFLLAAGGATDIMLRRNDAIEQLATYNVSFIATQASAEMERLHVRVLGLMAGAEGVGEDDVRLHFDIVVNRINIIGQGDSRRILFAQPGAQRLLHRLNAFAGEGEALVADLGDPAKLDRLARLIASFEEDLAELVSIGKMKGGERIAETQDQLRRLQTGALALFGFLAGCGAALTALLWWAQRSNALLAERERDLDVQNGRFDAALNNMGQALCMVDDAGRLIVCNQRFRDMFGLGGDLAPAGTPMAALLRTARRGGRFPPGLIARIREGQNEILSRAARGSFVVEEPGAVALSVTHESLPEGGWLATYEDITESRRAEARFAHLAMHDSLTGLPNRLSLRERLDRALAAQRRRGDPFAVFCLDLDHFKDVNDTLGHPVGDALLREVSSRILSCLREGDLVARLGGDEFAILQFGVGDRDEAVSLASRVIEAVCAPYLLEGHRVIIGTSAGIAVAPDDGLDADSLMKSADLALYKAKGEGRGTFRFFEAALGNQVRMQRAIELDLREAIGKGELEVYYQPQLELATNAIRGCEALLRWRHPRLGFVSPAQFIPVAEKIGLIARLGEWVLREACRAAADWPVSVRVAVNLSPAQFRTSDVVQVVGDVLAATGLPARRLELEITESVLLQDSPQVIAALHALRGMGVGISLDDFGTGYSSPSYLLRFPFDKVKIDKCFVSADGMDARAISVVRSISRLAAELGITTTAEGVETAEQMERMRDAHCTDIQGFLISPPRPLRELRRFLGMDLEAEAA